MKLVRFAMALCGLALMAVSVPAADTPASGSSQLRPAPPLVINFTGGKGQEPLSQYKGKVVALEFIYTTCPHCRAASHLMSKLQTEYGPRGLQVLDVAVNPNADLMVDDFAKEEKTTFPVAWVLPAQMTSFMGFGDGRFVVPQLVLIDRKGMIHYQTPAIEDDNWDKLMNEQNLRKHIEELLNGNSAARAERPVHSHMASEKKSS